MTLEAQAVSPRDTVDMIDVETLRPSRSAQTPAQSIDAEVLTELRRGSTFGRTLTRPMRELLNMLVADEATPEQNVLGGGHPLVPFRRARIRNRVNRLIAMRFVHREGGNLRPTIAGIGAVRPLSTAAQLVQHH
ncbi:MULTISPECIES: hypothetical protein [Bacteria]|uniref:hypothetical protein n=1 Tax=Bacteria TaxID=2 RepID=UPI003C7BFBE5